VYHRIRDSESYPKFASLEGKHCGPINVTRDSGICAINSRIRVIRAPPSLFQVLTAHFARISIPMLHSCIANLTTLKFSRKRGRYSRKMRRQKLFKRRQCYGFPELEETLNLNVDFCCCGPNMQNVDKVAEKYEIRDVV
jgi:hypothetical protein